MVLTNDIVKLIRSFAVDYETVNVLYDYSGRNMFGKTYFGISGYLPEIRNLLKYITKELAEMPDEYDMNFDDWLDMAFEYCQDNMGHDALIYWPNIQVEEEEE